MTIGSEDWGADQIFNFSVDMRYSNSGSDTTVPACHKSGRDLTLTFDHGNQN